MVKKEEIKETKAKIVYFDREKKILKVINSDKDIKNMEDRLEEKRILSFILGKSRYFKSVSRYFGFLFKIWSYRKEEGILVEFGIFELPQRRIGGSNDPNQFKLVLYRCSGEDFYLPAIQKILKISRDFFKDFKKDIAEESKNRKIAIQDLKETMDTYFCN